jgi:hypothetical protein
MQIAAPDGRFGPLMAGTPKGDIRHLVPPTAAITAMDCGAQPALLLFPRFGFAGAVREVAPGETFMRLTQASTNYVALGETGFRAMTRFVQSVPARAIDYQSGEEAIRLVAKLWDRIK